MRALHAIRSIFLRLVGFSAAFFLAAPAWAQISYGDPTQVESTRVNQFIKAVLNYFGGFVLLVIVGLLIYTGLKFAAKGANPQERAEATGRLANIIIGGVIIVAATFIAGIIYWIGSQAK